LHMADEHFDTGWKPMLLYHYRLEACDCSSSVATRRDPATQHKHSACGP
jgi:hypothetical protein